LGVPFAAAPYPHNRKTRKPVSPLLDFKAFGITKRTRNPVLARRVIEYLTGIGVQQRYTAAVSKLPANTEAWSIIEGKNPYYDTLYKSYRAGTVIPPANSYKIYKNTMWKLLRFALTGQLTAEETLRKGQEIIDNKLKARR
jgi:maltose-binding protein MalE